MREWYAMEFVDIRVHFPGSAFEPSAEPLADLLLHAAQCCRFASVFHYRMDRALEFVDKAITQLPDDRELW